MDEENKKIEDEIKKRQNRFNKNEREYREEIKHLERELRIRHGNEPFVREENLRR